MNQEQEQAAQNIDNAKLKQLKEVKTTDSMGKKVLMVLLMILLVAGAAFGGWWYRDQEARKQLSAKDAEIATLQEDLAAVQGALEAAETTTEEDSATGPSEETLDNIQAAVSSKNYAALEGYMGEEVTVIKAATECCGALSVAEALAEMAYLESATTPWDFELSSETLAGFADGDYADYFPEDALVGKSANGYVVAFTFNDAGEISGVFMIVNADLL